MLDALNRFSGQVAQSLPALRIDTAENILNKMQKIAVPVIVAVGAAHAQGADAIGTIGCILCVAGAAATGGIGIAACIPICVLAGVTISVPIF